MSRRPASRRAPSAHLPPPRGVHDLGGLPAGQVDTHEHEPTLTERRIDAMMGLLRDDKRRLWRTDENRRTIESLTPEIYEGSGYYARWTLAMRGLLVEKGVLTEGEIAKRLAEVKARSKSGTKPKTTTKPQPAAKKTAAQKTMPAPKAKPAAKRSKAR